MLHGMLCFFDYFLRHSNGENRKSASNCARSYSLAHSDSGSAIPEDWPFKPALKGDHVYTGFVILSLLEDYRDRQGVLTVPHDGDHGKRFKQAICDRNVRIKLYGQPEILHACEKCVRVYPEQNKCEFDLSTSRLFTKKTYSRISCGDGWYHHWASALCFRWLQVSTSDSS